MPTNRASPAAPSGMSASDGAATSVALYLVGFVGLLSIWFVASALLGNPLFLPGPVSVAEALSGLVADGSLEQNVMASLGRVLAGYALGAALALIAGVIIGVSRSLERPLEPVIELFRSIPPFAMIPLALLAFGIHPAGKIAILAYATFFPVLINTVSGISQVSNRLVEAAQTLGASKVFIVFRVLLPAAMPQVVVGLRLGFGSAWLALIAAEMVASSEGLGFLISDARELLETDVVLGGMFVIGMIGYLFNLAFTALERKSRTT